MSNPTELPDLDRLEALVEGWTLAPAKSDGAMNAAAKREYERPKATRGSIYTAMLAAAPSAPGTPEAPEPTYMTNEQAERWAWEQVKLGVGTEGWTTGESGTYFGFFLWGWLYRAQYERQRQRAAQLDGGQEGSESNG